MNKMKCNACWRELEGQAVSTTCGHLICTDDVDKILGNDGACPICDQVLLKSHMRTVDLNPSDDWTNMAMAGISPPTLLNSAYKSVMFFIGQKELEMQYKLNRIVGQCRQKCELMHAEFNKKLEEVHTAYQKMAERCQLMEQDIENLNRDKHELEKKFEEKSSQKRKLDKMYDQLRNEYQSAKRSAFKPSNNNYLGRMPQFEGMHSIMDGGKPPRQGRRQEGWCPPPRQRRSTSGPFEMSAGSGPPAHAAAPQADMRTRQPARPAFKAPMNHPSTALRNLIISPDKRPQLSCNSENIFSARRPPPFPQFHCPSQSPSPFLGGLMTTRCDAGRQGRGLVQQHQCGHYGDCCGHESTRPSSRPVPPTPPCSSQGQGTSRRESWLWRLLPKD